MLYNFDHPSSGSQVFLSRDVMETLTDITSLHREGFHIESEISPEGDLIAVIIESEGLQADERETLDHHYSRVIDMMETFTSLQNFRPENYIEIVDRKEIV